MDFAKRIARRLLRKDGAGLARDDICWMHQTKRGSCNLCSIFLQRSDILKLFATQWYPLGGFKDLLAWAEKGCPLSIYIRDSFYKDWVKGDPIKWQNIKVQDLILVYVGRDAPRLGANCAMEYGCRNGAGGPSL
jgi:hypothetical protein